MSLHLEVTANQSGRDFVIGDLHGMYPVLQQHLLKVQFDPTRDRLFSVGDLIDRGSANEACIELLDEPWFYAVQGNHERLMIEGILYDDANAYSMWLMNGGNWSLEHSDQDLIAIAEKLDQQMPLTITIDIPDLELPVGICHAEFPYDHWQSRHQISDIRSTDSSPLMWSRNQLKMKLEHQVEGLDRLFLGHTPVHNVTVLGNCWHIDTGCYQSGILTMINLMDEYEIPAATD
jgi:serine/threonine protein phosphatase 1